MDSYDLLIVGTGPAGVQAALRARRSGRRTAVVERMELVGGTCLHRGTIPSKTLRQAVIDLSGFREWGIYVSSRARRPRIPMQELRDRCDRVVAAEVGWQERLLTSRGVDVIRGCATFEDPHTLRVEGQGDPVRVRGERILVCVGSAPVHPENVPFDGRTVLDSDQILDLDELPHSLTVVGGGVIGSEYASIFSLLDVDVTLVNRRGTPLAMPTDYDDFSEAAHVDATGTPSTAARNARRLRAAMERRGFIAFPTEWWHFDWKGWQELPVVRKSEG